MSGDTVFPAVPPAVAHILQVLQDHGHQAVLAGGCVRDALLGGIPHDWDIATSAHPGQVESLFPRTVPVGRNFGIVVVLGSDGVGYEVATFRGEDGYSDGRHPDSIRFVAMEEDVKRRDFTVNALLYDPMAGRLYDFVGGQDDLAARRLRAVGDPRRRFTEDKLRTLRAIRFAARLGFDIDPDTMAAIGPVAPMVPQCVSPERIAAESEKILLGGSSRRAFGLMEQSGLLKYVYPLLFAMIGVEQPPQFHPEGDVWQHTLKALGIMDGTIRRCRAAAPDAPRFDDCGQLQRAGESELRMLSWATLLHDIGKPPTFVRGEDRIRFNRHDELGAAMAGEYLAGLHLPNEIIDGAVWLVRGHMNQLSMAEARLATRRRHLQHPLYPLMLELVRIDTMASFGGMQLHRQLLEWWKEEQARPIPPKPTLNGRDLIAIGIPPGPNMGKILREAADHELEQPFASREEAIDWVKRHCL